MTIWPRHLAAITLVLSTPLTGCTRTAPTATASDEQATGQTTPLPAAYRDIRELVDLEDMWVANGKAKAWTEREPQAVLAWVALAAASMSSAEKKAALKRAREIGAANRPLVLAELDVARHLAEGQSDFALSTAEAAAKAHPRSIDAQLNRLRVLYARGDHAALRDHASDTLALDADSLSANALLGESYTFADPRDLKLAEKYYGRTTQLRPQVPTTYINLGDVFRAGGDLPKAFEQYSRALTLAPEHPIASVKRGHVNSFLGKFDEARADYDRALGTGTVNSRISLGNYRSFVSLHEGKPQACLDELAALDDNAQKVEVSDGERLELRSYILHNRASVALHQLEFEKGSASAADAAVSDLMGLLNDGAKASKGPTRQAYLATMFFWDGRHAAVRGDLRAARRSAELYREALKADTDPRKLERYHELMGMIAHGDKQYATAVTHFKKGDHEHAVSSKFRWAQALQSAGDAPAAAKLYGEVADWGFNSVDFALLKPLADQRRSP